MYLSFKSEDTASVYWFHQLATFKRKDAVRWFAEGRFALVAEDTGVVLQRIACSIEERFQSLLAEWCTSVVIVDRGYFFRGTSELPWC